MNGLGWLPWLLIVLLAVLLAVLALLVWRAGGMRRLWSDTAPNDRDPVPAGDPDELAPPMRLRTAIAVALRELRLLLAGARGAGDVPWVMTVGAGVDEVAAMLPPPVQTRHAVSWTDEARIAKVGTLDFREGGVAIGFSDGLLDGERVEHRLGALLRELEVIRPDRPLDAVTVMVPWEALAIDAEDGAARATVVARGRRIYEILLQVQRRTGWRLPVHLVVSRCEQVPGFGSYAEAALERSDNPVMGWPAPWSLDTAFETQWIEEAFETLRKTLSTQQFHLLMGVDDERLAEQVMLFPGRLAAIRPALTILVTQMLESSAYHEGFMLRGVFLAGASSPRTAALPLPALNAEAGTASTAQASEADTVGSTAMGQVPELDLALAGALPRTWGGADEPGPQRLAQALFARKIFPETGLAQPAYGERTRRHRMVRHAQAALAAAFLLSMVGYAGIVYQNDEELPHVAQLLTGIEDSQDRAREIRRVTQDPATGRCRADAALPRENPRTLADFAQQKQLSIALLERMSDLEVNRVQTVLAPTSYLTDANHRVEQAIRTSFRDVVFHAIAQSMATGPGIRLLIDRDAAGADPDTLWKTTVANAVDYDTNYRRLRRLADRDAADAQSVNDFAAVIRYAMGEELPPQFTRNYQLYSAGISGYAVPCVGSGPVQDAIGGLIEENYLAALGQFYVRNPVRVTVDALDLRFGEGSDMSDPSLRRLVDDLSSVATELAVPGRYAWIAATRPSDLVLPETRRLRSLTVLPPGLADRLGARGGPAALDAAARLRAADLFGAPILSVGAASIPTALSDGAMPPAGAPPGASGPRLSQAMIDTQAYLRLLFAQPFMAEDAGGVSVDDVGYGGPGWDYQRLHDAGDLVKAYVGFADTGGGTMPLELRDAARQTARRHLAAVLTREIARATPATDPRSATASDRFVRELPTLTGLRDDVRSAGLEDVSALLDARVSQRAAAQFQAADAELAGSGFYVVDPRAVARWNGVGSLAAAAFDAADPEDLVAKLAEWRGAIAAIAQGRAAPLVGYLTDPATATMSASGPRLAFWKQILDTLKAYDAKTPNALSRLETFIAVDIDRTSRDCGALAARRVVASDYFSRVQATIAAQLARRCRSVGAADLRSRFARVRAAFAELLAGRFPFSADADAPGADPDDVRRFFAEHGDELQALKDAIDAADGPGTAAAVAIDRLIRARAALSPMLADGGGPLAYKVAVRFFTDSSIAAGQDQVIQASVGTSASRAAAQSGDASFSWVEGQTLSAMFRWAINAPNVPGRQEAPAGLRCAPPADDATVRFREAGDWTLLRLIRRRAPGDAAQSATSGTPIAFVVPLCSNRDRAPGGDPVEGSGRVFLRLSLTAARADGPSARILLPTFPSSLPPREGGR